MFTIALPNGSLQSKTLELFRKAGIKLPDPTRQHWVEIGHELVKTIVWMRPQHIPGAISDDMVDGGITGEDCNWEWYYTPRGGFLRHLRQWARFSYSSKTSKPNNVVLVSGKDETADPYKGEQVFTEFPNWTEARLLRWKRVRAIPAHGSVEAFIPHRYRFGVTITETGNSLRVNGLKVVKVLASSSPILLSGGGFTSAGGNAFRELAKKLTQSERGC